MWHRAARKSYLELGLPCIGEPPYYVAQGGGIAVLLGSGGRGKEERSGPHRRNLATPTPEGGELRRRRRRWPGINPNASSGNRLRHFGFGLGFGVGVGIGLWRVRK